MRYWGKNIEIDGSFYTTPAGKLLIPTDVEKAQAKAAGNYYQYEGDVDLYEVTVQNMLRDIESNEVGKILIDAIARSKSKVRIIPLTSKEQSQLKRIPCANPIGKYHPQGNESVIWFEPWSRMWNLLTGFGSSPYQVLVHELHHSLRQVRGKWYPTGPVGGFPNAEELFAVMIENMYLSSAKQPQRMLGAYNQNVPLGGRSAASFYKQYGNEIEVWFGQLKDVGLLLERVYGIWNPVMVRRMVLDFALDLRAVN